MTTNDGGLASACSLREWYAGLAMQGLLADGIAHDAIARLAYELADTMIAQRKQD